MLLGTIAGLFKRKSEGEATSSSDGRIRLALILGAAAVLLIVLSDCISCDSTGGQSVSVELSAQEYADNLENRLCSLISRVDGAGETEVMVTLSSGVEYIYASEEQISTDESESSDSTGKTGSDSSSDSQSSYIIIENEDGEEALVRTQLMPRVSGVVVLCEGADDQTVAGQIQQIVITALGISSRRVYVARLAG